MVEHKQYLPAYAQIEDFDHKAISLGVLWDGFGRAMAHPGLWTELTSRKTGLLPVMSMA